MVTKVDRDVYRIWKECPPYLLQVFYQEGAEGLEMLRLKIMDHPQQQKKFGFYQKVYYYKDYNYMEMPELIRSNFANLKEIFEEMRLTSRDNFRFNPDDGLRIGLQVGSKIKHCLFPLQQLEHTYLEIIETMLWVAQTQADKQPTPESQCFYEMMQLKAINERNIEEIANLSSMLKKQIHERKEAQKKIQEITTQLQAEIYELKLMNEASKSSESQAPKRPIIRTNREPSSLICDERVHRQIEFINLVQENSWLAKIEQFNKIPGLARFKFKLDSNSTTDPGRAFERDKHKITNIRRDQMHRQLVSLVPIHQPIGLVSFKLISTKAHNIFVGIVLENRIKLRCTTRDPASISYKLNGSGLWVDSIRSGLHIVKIEKDEILTLLIDMGRRKMQWWKFGDLLGEGELPQSFYYQNMYPFVNMMQGGDCVEIV